MPDGGRGATAAADPLSPYVPRLVVDWLADEPAREHRTVSGTLVFADISGFTALTERLAARGKAGAEEMADLLNAAFEDLLTAAYDYGANLMKWGGDAVLLLFDADGHTTRAARAAWAMQEVMRRIGRLDTSRGVVRLGMSIGVHSGEVDFLFVGSQHRELVVTGPAASMTARMEKIAQRGEVMLSATTAALLPAACLGGTRDGAMRLARPPELDATPNRTPKRSGIDLGPAMCADLREHLRAGSVEHEHRSIAVGFVEFAGADRLRADGETAFIDAIRYVINAAQEAAVANEVTLLATDLAEDGGKIIFTSGAPRSAGDDETRMLSTIRRIVHPGGRLRLRGGVTCGPVFAGDYGPFYRRTYSIAGDVVNLAARLMAKAAPGQVLATHAVLDRSRTAFDTTPLEPFLVKGKKTPVVAAVVGELRRASEPVVADRLPLVGRDAELAVLSAAAERATRGAGGAVDIVGPAGIGKSRLIEEVGTLVDARMMWADGDIYASTHPYQPLQRLLRRTLALPINVDPAGVAAALHDLVAGSAPDLLPWLPLIAIPAGVDVAPTPEVTRLDPSVRRARLEAVTSDLLGRLLTKPLVMIFNDIHFMDDATIGLVRRLAEDAVRRPWLVITTRRPNVAAVVASAHLTTITLEALDGDAAGQLVAAATDAAPLPPHRIRELTERAGGNPMFLTHLVAAAAAGADLDELPDTVEGIIAAQIDRLPAPRRRWLRAASVLGMTVDPTLLQGILAGTDIENETWVGLDEFLTMNVDARLRFVHHLVRLTAYEGLPYRRRTELHARAALILETALGRRRSQQAALLSLHCVRGEIYDSAWRYARLAGDQARARFAPAEAAECYRRALTAAGHLPTLSQDDLVDVYTSLAETCMDLGEMAQAEQALRAARSRAKGDPIRLARLHLATAAHRQHLGRHGEALRWVGKGRSAIRALDGETALALRAQLGERGAGIRYDQGAYRAGMVWARRAADEARRAGDFVTAGRACGMKAVNAAAAGLPWDEDGVRAALDMFASVGDHRGRVRLSNALGMCSYFAGRWDAAVRHYAVAEQAARQIGRDFDAAGVAANRAEVLVQQGRIDEADTAITEAIRVLVALEARSLLGFATMLSGRVALARGDYPEAMNRLGEARELCVEMGEREETIFVDALAAECHVRAGEPREALRRVEIALAQVGEADEVPGAEPLLLRVRAEALVELGEYHAGAALLHAALRSARARHSSYDIAATLSALLHYLPAAAADERAGWQDELGTLQLTLGMISAGGAGDAGAVMTFAPVAVAPPAELR
jgi:class 3 adenylate cyclase/tetratricopeptide (TPR) repeat protein